MEATRGVVAVLILSLLLAVGCSQGAGVNSSALNGQFCVGSALQDSFLVKWKSDVPGEFNEKKLSPDSLITRFNGTTKEAVEGEILARYPNDYELAEYEFHVATEAPQTDTCDITPQPDWPTVWGPTNIQASAAWNYLGKKGDGVVVAVVDSGIDVTHSLLSSAIWQNPNPDPTLHDYNGYDFMYNNNNIQDPQLYSTCGHGTHVSGIIAGQAGPNNFTGVAPNAKLMGLKFIEGSAGGDSGNAVSAMEYALTHGARVINASWGGGCSTLIKQEIIRVTQGGVLFANAAGNSDVDINQSPQWPAAFQIAGKVTIASLNMNGFLSSFSNYGILVDLAAPGENILSTVPPMGGSDNQLSVKSGTSMATPFVAGVAALLFSAKPTASVYDVANAINSAIDLGGYNVRTQGRLDALAAAQYLMSH